MKRLIRQIYNLAFGIYGLSEYYRTTGGKESIKRAVELYRITENYAYDQENGGYFEAFTRDWLPLEDMRLGSADMNEKKSMNTHLHVLEAYTNLYRVWKDEGLEKKLNELIREKVIERFDHRNLYLDVEDFRDLNPSAENIAIRIWQLLREHIDPKFALEIELFETERNFVLYSGPRKA